MHHGALKYGDTQPPQDSFSDFVTLVCQEAQSSQNQVHTLCLAHALCHSLFSLLHFSLDLKLFPLFAFFFKAYSESVAAVFLEPFFPDHFSVQNPVHTLLSTTHPLSIATAYSTSFVAFFTLLGLPFCSVKYRILNKLLQLTKTTFS